MVFDMRPVNLGIKEVKFKMKTVQRILWFLTGKMRAMKADEILCLF
jgi:hypothetical protein